jgi:hypothetical protein
MQDIRFSISHRGGLSPAALDLPAIRSPAYMLQQSSLAGEISQQRDSISRRMAGRCVNHILNFVILASQGNPLSLVCKISYCMYAPSPSPNIASLFDPFLHQS